ncbi:MAG: MarR family winged helix-turn-helix transcriptional regulator [Pseudonocardia sp.]
MVDDEVDPGADAVRTFVERDPARMALDVLLSRAGAAATRHRQRAAVTHGATATGLALLGVLVEDNELSHRDLAARLGITPATLTPVVDALEAVGEVRRVRDGEDRRIVRLVIMDAGTARWASTAGAVAKRAQAALPRLSRRDEAVVRTYLAAVLTATGER